LGFYTIEMQHLNVLDYYEMTFQGLDILQLHGLKTYSYNNLIQVYDLYYVVVIFPRFLFFLLQQIT